MTRMKLTAAIILTLFAVAGCGYNQGSPAGGYSQSSLFRQDVKTVAVPIFVSKSFTRGVEFQLSKAITEQIESTTPYKVVPAERADSVLEGQVVEVGLSTVSSDNRAAIPQEQLYRVVVNFTWKDLRTGKILVERRNFEQTSTFYPTMGEGRFVGSQQATESLARGIVQELQADW